MFSSDQDYSQYPYQLLIRARTQAQFERAIIIIASRIATTAVSARVSEKLTKAAMKAASVVAFRDSGSGRAPSATSVVSALQLMADFDDWCGTRWPRWPWPWPGPWPWQEVKPSPDPWINSGLIDAVALKTIISLAKLAPEVGSELLDTSQAIAQELAG
jgi:hypothetical protein